MNLDDLLDREPGPIARTVAWLLVAVISLAILLAPAAAGIWGGNTGLSVMLGVYIGLGATVLIIVVTLFLLWVFDR